MDELMKALGAIIGTVAMGFECLLWGGVDLARRVISRTYVLSLIIITGIAVIAPLSVLVFGLAGGALNISKVIAALVALTVVAPSVLATFKDRGLNLTRLIGMVFGIFLTIWVYTRSPMVISGQSLIVFSGFLFLALACIWWVAAVPATLLIGAGVEIGEFFVTKKPAPRPAPSPVPTPSKKK